MKCKKCGEYAICKNVTIHEFIFKTGIEKKKLVNDRSNEEFIWKTGYCRMCLIDMGYCS